MKTHPYSQGRVYTVYSALVKNECFLEQPEVKIRKFLFWSYVACISVERKMSTVRLKAL